MCYRKVKTVHIFPAIFLGVFQYNLIPFLHFQTPAAVETLQHFLLPHEVSTFHPKKFRFLLSPRIFHLCSTSSCGAEYLLSRLVSEAFFFFKALSKIQQLFFLSTSNPTIHILVQISY